jgi:methylase of polypeptide subunit release factors
MWLSPGGTVACEVSEFHADSVVKHFNDIEASVVKDLTGRDRFVVGVRVVE